MLALQKKLVTQTFFSDPNRAKLLAYLTISEVTVVQQIGFVGLGAMGSVMAPLPVHAGFSVIGFDTAPHQRDLAGIDTASSLNDMVACDTIITMLPDGAAVLAVATTLANAGFCGLF